MADAEFGTLWTEFVQSRKASLPGQIDLLKLLETSTADLFRHHATFESARHALGTAPEQIRCSSLRSDTMTKTQGN